MEREFEEEAHVYFGPSVDGKRCEPRTLPH